MFCIVALILKSDISSITLQVGSNIYTLYHFFLNKSTYVFQENHILGPTFAQN